MYRIYCSLCGVIGGGSGRAVDHSYGSKVGTSLRALWAKYSPMSRSLPYVGLREKLESPKKKLFSSCQHTKDKLRCQFRPITSYFFFI